MGSGVGVRFGELRSGLVGPVEREAVSIWEGSWAEVGAFAAVMSTERLVVVSTRLPVSPEGRSRVKLDWAKVVEAKVAMV